MTTVCICGGGNEGHVLAGYIGSKREYRVNLLTRHPELWQGELRITDCNGNVRTGHLDRISGNPEEVIPQSDLILLCVPGFAIADDLAAIRPYLDGHHVVGSVVSCTGFFFIAHEVLPPGTGLFGFQRVPFISRTDVYGRSASLLGFKRKLELGTESVLHPELLGGLLQDMLDTPVELVSHYLEVSLSNGNPLLHPCRLYTLFRDYRPGMYYPRHFLFYEEWDDATSDLLLRCDREFMAMLEKLPVHPECIVPLADYYESHDISAFSGKIRSIEAFKGLKAPMKYTGPAGYIPDFGNRYFVEDFPYGLSVIRQLALGTGTPVPNIDRIMEWGGKFISVPAPEFKIDI